MASSSQYQGKPHDNNNCPEFRRQRAAEAKATAVYDEAKPIVKDRRGHAKLPDLDPATAFATFKALMAAGQISRVETDTIFDNKLEAQKYREKLLEPMEEQDPTIPRSQAERKAHVVIIIKAFRHVDNDGGAEKVKQDFRQCKHDRWLVECLAWDLLDLLIRRSKSVGNLVETYEPSKYKFKKCHDLDFADRFEYLVSAMATNKSMCKHLYDVPYALKVIDDPQTNVERIQSNRRLNRQKAEIMKKGKEATAEDGKQNKRGKKRSLDQSDEDATKAVTKKRKAATTTPVNSAMTRASPAQQPMCAPPATPLNTQVRGRLPPQPSPAVHNPGVFNNAVRGRAFTQPMTPMLSANLVSASPRPSNYGHGMRLDSNTNQFGANAAVLTQRLSHPYGQVNMPSDNHIQLGPSSVTMLHQNVRTLDHAARVYEDYEDDQTSGADWYYQTQPEQNIGRRESVHSPGSTISPTHAGAHPQPFFQSPYGGTGYHYQAIPSVEDYQGIGIGAMNEETSGYPDLDNVHNGMPSPHGLGLDPASAGHDDDAPYEYE